MNPKRVSPGVTHLFDVSVVEDGLQYGYGEDVGLLGFRYVERQTEFLLYARRELPLQ